MNERQMKWKKITRKLLCKAYVIRIYDLFILLAHIRARFTAETDVWKKKQVTSNTLINYTLEYVCFLFSLALCNIIKHIICTSAM